MSNKVRIIITSAIVLSALVYIIIVQPLFAPNVQISGEKTNIKIPSNSSFENVLEILNENKILKNEESFKMMATLMRYNKESVLAGNYEIENDWTNRKLIIKLRAGNQDAIKIVLNNIRLLSDLAGKVGNYFESDSLTFLNYISDPENSNLFSFTPENFLTMFIPNTYEMFWTTKPEKFVKRMNKEYVDFWNQERLNKLNNLNINQTEAYIIASIVEKESNYGPERPIIAGVYLNRLKTGQKLQADPTVVFATGNFATQRVLFSHLTFDSPYNTYLYEGLPPGPICMPSLASIEAVINAQQHNYIFFCAKPDNSGIHVFAETYTEHQKNAQAFSKWMDKNKIK